MTTNKHTNLKCFLVVCFLFCMVILTACKPKASASKPTPDLEEWDLLIISDSSNWWVGSHYAKLIEADMNVKVNLNDCWVDGMSIGKVLGALQSGESWSSMVWDEACFKPLPDLIKEAEVMVLLGNPEDSYPPDGSWNIPESHKACYRVQGGYEGMNVLPGFEAYKDKMLKSCAPETWATYKAHLGAVLDEIDKIREGRPLILRMTDSYIPLHSVWKENDVDEVCTACSRYSSEAIHQVAEEHGVPFASTMVGLNGEDYMSEIPMGYMQSDGRHLTTEGAQFVATLIQKTGYDYAGK